MRRLAVVHLIGSALLLWLGYYWLGIGETRAMTLVWSAVVALVVLSLGCGLIATGLAYFGGAGLSLRRTPRVFAAAIALLVVYYLLAQWADYSSQPAFRVASWLTNALRKPVAPSAVLTAFNVPLWLLRWMVLPVLALAWAARWERRRSWLYWIEVPVLLVCALWLPLKLMGWTPHGGFAMEMTSFVVRALIAYLLFVAGWLALEFVTSGGKPRVTQPSSAVSP